MSHNWAVAFNAFSACITAQRLSQRGEEFDVYEYTYTDKKGNVSSWRAYAILGKGKDISIVRDPHVASADAARISLDNLVAQAKSKPVDPWWTDRHPETVKWIEEYKDE